MAMKSSVCFMLVNSLAQSSALKMEAIFPVKRRINFTGLHSAIAEYWWQSYLEADPPTIKIVPIISMQHRYNLII
jgi:hypothetical protein